LTYIFLSEKFGGVDLKELKETSDQMDESDINTTLR
jgi:hypothetical protein